MSITGISESNKVYKKSFHRRNDSDELDVFEAARYFSGYNEAAAGYTYNTSGAGYAQKVLREDDWRGRRKSLDVTIRNPIPQQNSVEKQKMMMMKDKKYKQPSSPGGRLASFLNSLFNQTSSKKKKSKSTTTQSMKDEDESPGGGRRKRRSSISHFRSTSTTTTDTTKSLYSSSSSGFRTPPHSIQTPNKMKPSAWKKEAILEEKLNKDLSWLDEKKFRFSTADAFPEKPKKNWAEEKQFRRFSQVDDDDDGAESDSSSDLFELQNYDLGIYSSSELPVYETTNMNNIKRGAPISN